MGSLQERYKVAIVGSGNWGSVAAKLIASNTLKHNIFHDEVRMWVYDETLPNGEKLPNVINQTNVNVKYLPGVQLGRNVVADPDLVHAGMADWSSLPCELLELIVLKLENIEDHAYFSAVCRSWNCAYLSVRGSLKCSKLPFLLLAEDAKENSKKGLRRLFSLSSNKLFNLELPEIVGSRCWGSSYGWLATLNRNMELNLFNPFTKARHCLPNPLYLPNRRPNKQNPPIQTEWTQRERNWYFESFVRRVVVMEVKTENHDDFLIFVFFNADWTELAFAKLGDPEWTLIPGPYNLRTHGARDVCYWDNRIVVLFGDASVRWCDLSTTAPCMIDLVSRGCPRLTVNKSMQRRMYLVNSFGDFLMVVRYKADRACPSDPYKVNEDNPYEAIRLEVFGLDVNIWRWEKRDNLNGSSLFVRHNDSISIHTNKCEGNSVYMT